jgi:hypothetical protein
VKSVQSSAVRAHSRAGDALARKILRLFTWAMIGMFIGSAIGLALGPY